MTITVLRNPRTVKCFCVTFILAGLFNQIESLPAYWSTAQENKPANAKSSTPAVEQPLADPEAARGPGDAEPASDKIKRAEWVQIGINTFIALVIFWQAWTYYKQRQVMERQERIARVAERAYIGVKGVKIENFTIGKEPVVRVTILNGGRTPAWRLKAPATLNIATEFPFERPEQGDVVGTFFMPAGLTTTFSYPFASLLTPTRHHAIQTGELGVFLHMEVHFDDCWGEPQFSTFRLEYRAGTDGRWSEYKNPDDVRPKISEL